MARRRFQFRLRTLFIVVTIVAVVCCYVGHEYRIVKTRQEWVTDRVPVFEAADVAPKEINKRNPATDPSLIRRWLGDKAETYIDVDSEADAATAKSLFPEATIKLVVNSTQPAAATSTGAP